MCLGGPKKLDLRSGSKAIDISLTCPSKHRHGANLFTVIPRNCSISVAFYDAHGDTEKNIFVHFTAFPCNKAIHIAYKSCTMCDTHELIFQYSLIKNRLISDIK